MAAAAALVGGCGGGDEGSSTPPGPRLPRELGEQLASQSEAVAEALEDGDCERAQALALSLQQDTIAAINSRRVPQRLLEDLQVGVNVLVDEIRCPPPPAPPAETFTSTGDEEGGGGQDGDD